MIEIRDGQVSRFVSVEVFIMALLRALPQEVAEQAIQQAAVMSTEAPHPIITAHLSRIIPPGNGR